MIFKAIYRFVVQIMLLMRMFLSNSSALSLTFILLLLCRLELFRELSSIIWPMLYFFSSALTTDWI